MSLFQAKSEAYLRHEIGDDAHSMRRINEYYIPVFSWLHGILTDNASDKAPVIGINGQQGCGKSTLCQYICELFKIPGKRVISVSVDDFYLTNEQQRLTAQKNPDNPYQSGQQYEGFGDASDIFAEILRQRGHGKQQSSTHGFNMRGQDRRYALEIPFMDAVLGGKTRITLPDGGALDVKIPQGTADGQIIRLRGKGSPGFEGGTAGDALVTLSVQPHQLFRREGNDILITLPITLDEAVLGGKVETPTIEEAGESVAIVRNFDIAKHKSTLTLVVGYAEGASASGQTATLGDTSVALVGDLIFLPAMLAGPLGAVFVGRKK